MQGCQHERTEFLHRRDGIDYVRCLDCGQVFEAEDLDLDSVPVYEEDEEEKKPKKRR
jgi:Zn ribbon nucleic-acid-binding protein